MTAPLPALVTVTAGVVEPRYASFKGIMAAKSKPLEMLSVADLGLGGQVGAAGAREEITRSRPPRGVRPVRSTSTRETAPRRSSRSSNRSRFSRRS